MAVAPAPTPSTATTSPIRIPWALVIEWLWVAAALLAADVLAIRLAGGSDLHLVMWPGPGIALAVLILRGLDRWPAIPIAAFSLALLRGASPAIGLAGAIGDTLQVLLSFGILRARNFALPFSTVRRTIDLLAVCGIALPISGATIGMLALAAAAHTPTNALGRVWATWAMSAGSGAVMVTPFILGLATESPARRLRLRPIEASLLTAMLLAVAIGSYSGLMDIGEGEGLAALAFPFVIWAALGFGTTVVSAVTLMVAVVVVYSTSRVGSIPTGIESLLGAFYRDFLCGTLVGSGLILAAVFEESRRQAEALAASEANFRRLIQQASDAILLTSGIEGRFVGSNARASELLGYRPEEFARLSITDLIPPEDRTSKPPREIDSKTRPLMFERAMQHKDGRRIMVEVSATRLEDGRVQAILRDISTRKRAEAELREALATLQATLDSTTDGILVVDGRGKIRSFNRKFQELWRIPDPILDARDDERAIHFVLDQLSNPDAFLAQVRHLYSHPAETSFDVLEFKDGRVFERYSQPQIVTGEAEGRVWSFRDVTLRLSLENQLRHAQKMEAIGSLAGGVAHDFNNLLTAIMGHSSLLLTQLDDGHPLREDVSEIHRASERAAFLTRQLLTFSRHQLLEPSVHDLGLVVQRIQKMLARTLGETIRIAPQISSETLYVNADLGQLEQLILNLSINARDAMPEGGTLTLETRAERVETSRDALGLSPGDYVVLAVTDTGIGMDEATRSRIFEPFFTTKDRGRGTGLGLSTVYAIVHQSGGAVEVQSEPGRGSRFSIYFHRTTEAPAVSEAPDDPTPAEKSPRGHGAVLLVEDEAMVRDLLVESLTSAGFQVTTAKHGQEALRLLSENHVAVDILVTDVVMPGLAGPELAARVLEKRPGIPVLYISGYTSDELGPRGPLEPWESFLQKPFSPASLIRKIRTALERPAQA
jgi:two-component system cell cycle sensor histidine kinase/response regulator CckA